MALPCNTTTIKNKPIGAGLNSIRGQLLSVCVKEDLPCSAESFQKLDTEGISLDLVG